MPTLLKNISGMPQMKAAFSGWQSNITVQHITQEIENGFVKQNERCVCLKGTWQPLSPEEIALKPDGQRSWEWIDLHIEGNKILFATNDLVIYRGIKYKIMAVKDYTLNNYSEYHLVLDYQESE